LEQSIPFGELYPQTEMVVLAGDMNGHVGSSNVSYNGTQGGFGYGDWNADESRILEFADGLNLVICNTLFMKQKSQLVTTRVSRYQKKHKYHLQFCFELKWLNYAFSALMLLGWAAGRASGV